MSLERHAPAGPAEERIALRTLALRLPPGHRIERHRHPWGQVVYATEGVMTVTTDAGAWVVPSHRAAWVPPDAAHEVETTGSVRMRTVYLRPDLAGELPRACCVLAVTPLLRELVLEAVRAGMWRDDEPAEARLARVLVDRLRATPEAPLELPWPRDPRARRVAEAARAELAEARPLEQLARGSGASVRTLERLFARETGLSFRAWRTRARVLHALRLLAAGESVTATALAVGFSGTSAFIAMFRRALGRAPGAYSRGPAPEGRGTVGTRPPARKAPPRPGTGP